MLTCITCSKQRVEDEEDAPRGTPNTKDAVKSLTTQVLPHPLYLFMYVQVCVYICRWMQVLLCVSFFLLCLFFNTKTKSGWAYYSGLLSDIQWWGPTFSLCVGPPFWRECGNLDGVLFGLGVASGFILGFGFVLS